MTPLAAHTRNVVEHGFVRDPAQFAAASALTGVYEKLVSVHARESSLTHRLRALLRPPDPVRGLYIWGGVGRGKTYLMDLFYECLPFEDKIRIHFHRFMHRVHADLTELSGIANPLQTVAERFAADGRVLCFDEFFVSDIGDAMILAELLDALFSRGVTVIATSNVEPTRLYENGLQRRRFLPAIDLIMRSMEVLNLDGPTDYRLRVLERSEIFHSPLDADAETVLRSCFEALAPESPTRNVELTVNGRPIRARFEADDVVWFDFDAICDGPRSQNDYIELAKIYHAVVISGVPILDAKHEDQARRFISLIDEFYDRNVKVVISAAAEIDALYRGERLGFEFERTVSRLLEMRSVDYLARSHRP